jgi:hypothetical protein
MMAGLWGMLGLITVLALVIALLVFTVIHQDGQLSKAHRQVAATQEQLDSLTEDFYDLKSEVQEWMLNGYSGDGVYQTTTSPRWTGTSSIRSPIHRLGSPPSEPSDTRVTAFFHGVDCKEPRVTSISPLPRPRKRGCYVRPSAPAPPLWPPALTGACLRDHSCRTLDLPGGPLRSDRLH